MYYSEEFDRIVLFYKIMFLLEGLVVLNCVLYLVGSFLVMDCFMILEVYLKRRVTVFISLEKYVFFFCIKVDNNFLKR